MSVSGNVFRYPEEIRDDFLQTADIQFRDGSKASPAEVWHYLTEIGPKKYPHIYDYSNYYGRKYRVTLPCHSR